MENVTTLIALSGAVVGAVVGYFAGATLRSSVERNDPAPVLDEICTGFCMLFGLLATMIACGLGGALSGVITAFLAAPAFLGAIALYLAVMMLLVKTCRLVRVQIDRLVVHFGFGSLKS